MTTTTKRRLRHLGLELAVKAVLLVAVAMTVIVFLYLSALGFIPRDGYATSTPAWMPHGVGAALHEAKVVYAAPWVAVVGVCFLWVCFFMARREVRREFPREVY